MTLNETLERLVKLTNENLNILNTINQSFTTKAEHLALTVNQTQYTIPSFIALENKIASLQQNLENLVNAPNTGECYMYFDGNSQRVELSGYSTCPTSLVLDAPNTRTFSVYNNDIFKDFVTPRPYIRFGVSALANSIKTLCIKKIVLKNQNLVNQILNLAVDANGNPVGQGNPTNNINYGDLYRIIFVYEEDKDYVEYDKTVRMPHRSQNCTGTYRIVNIIANYTDANFEEFYELELDRDLKYTINDDTIERDIHVGDELVTFNDKVKMQITAIQPLTRKITVKILENGYADLVAGNSDMALLKYFRSVDFDREKYIDVTLEEDRYVCIFIAGVNDTTNVRAPWSTGVFIDTNWLILDTDGTLPFSTYYQENVNNIGDTLYDITHFMNSQLYNMSIQQLNDITSYKPSIDAEKLIVTQINKHLNDSDTVKTIRSLYSQKTRYKNELDSTQRSIDNINDILATTSFSTNNNARQLYENQLAELNTRKTELTSNIVSISNDINETVNSSDTPIENAKYHVRGFVDFAIPAGLQVSGIPFEVIGIECEYRYKNRNKMSGNAETIKQDYIYTDWNRMPSILRKKHYKGDRGIIEWEMDLDNDNANETSFNQIDIPITQGEVVDIRYRWIYSLGYPFVAVRSDWSEIYTQDFPEEYLKDVPVLTIIEENNNEIQKNVYKTMLQELGVISHIDDKVTDQSITYFHDTQHIASGFYTDERRVIPLSDKLFSMNDLLNDLYTEVYGSYASNLSVTLSDDLNTITLLPDIDNVFIVQDYDSNTNRIPLAGSLMQSDPNNYEIALSSLQLTLTNIGQSTIKLHTLFPGDPQAILLNSAPISVFGGSNLWGADSNNCGVYLQTKDTLSGQAGTRDSGIALQQYNQILYFRTGSNYYIIPSTANNDWNISTNYDSSTSTWSNGNATTGLRKTFETPQAITPLAYQLYNPQPPLTPIGNEFSYADTTPPQPSLSGKFLNYSSLFAYITDSNSFFLSPGTSYLALSPGDSVSVPLQFYYLLKTPNNTLGQDNVSTQQTIAFDVRTSLFRDPTTYKITVQGNKVNNVSYNTMRKMKKGIVQNVPGVSVPYTGTLNLGGR